MEDTRKALSPHKQSISWALSTRNLEWSEQDKLFFLSHLNKTTCRDFSQGYLGTNPEILEGNKLASVGCHAESLREIFKPPCPEIISSIWLNTCVYERGFGVNWGFKRTSSVIHQPGNWGACSPSSLMCRSDHQQSREEVVNNLGLGTILPLRPLALTLASRPSPAGVRLSSPRGGDAAVAVVPKSLSGRCHWLCSTT